jgi:ABC-type dipeptide/oligopeptide/nickel transport system ATPase component
MATFSNTEMLANVIAILEHIKLNEELDNHDNFKKLMTKVTNAAMKGNNKVVVKQKKTSSAYNDFVKAKMPELIDAPKGEKFKLISEMWKAHKATNEPKVTNEPKTDKKPKADKEPKDNKKPKAVKEPKKTAKKTVVVEDSDDDNA